MIQFLSAAGALLILAAFALQQFGRWRPKDRPYLWFNFSGALILSVVAMVEAQWGFLLLEAVWTLVSLHSLLRRAPDDPSGSAA